MEIDRDRRRNRRAGIKESTEKSEREKIREGGNNGERDI